MPSVSDIPPTPSTRCRRAGYRAALACPRVLQSMTRWSPALGPAARTGAQPRPFPRSTCFTASTSAYTGDRDPPACPSWSAKLRHRWKRECLVVVINCRERHLLAAAIPHVSLRCFRHPLPLPAGDPCGLGECVSTRRWRCMEWTVRRQSSVMRLG